MRQAVPGWESIVLRVFGPANDVRWFKRLESAEQRGHFITTMRPHYQPEE